MQGQESDKIDRIKLHRAREKTTNLQLLLHYIYTLYCNYLKHFLHINLFLYISVISKKNWVIYKKILEMITVLNIDIV